MNVHMYGRSPAGAWVPMLVDSHGAPNAVRAAWKYAAASGGIVDTADVALAAAAGVGNSNYLKSIQFSNKDATVATEVVIKDGSTVIWRGWAPALMITPASVLFDPPLWSSSNAALNVAAITTSAELYVNAQGFVDVTPAALSAFLSIEEEIFDDLGELMTAPDSTTLTLRASDIN